MTLLDRNNGKCPGQKNSAYPRRVVTATLFENCSHGQQPEHVCLACQKYHKPLTTFSIHPTWCGPVGQQLQSQTEAGCRAKPNISSRSRSSCSRSSSRSSRTSGRSNSSRWSRGSIVAFVDCRCCCCWFCCFAVAFDRRVLILLLLSDG